MDNKKLFTQTNFKSICVHCLLFLSKLIKYFHFYLLHKSYNPPNTNFKVYCKQINTELTKFLKLIMAPK